jgi:hypothetical protein
MIAAFIGVFLATLTSVAPIEPPDGTATGARPVFLISYSGIEDRDLRHARFKIALSSDGFRSETIVFDQRRRRSGWVPGEPGRMVFRPRRPIVDGSYEWRAWIWDGADWSGGLETFKLRIDTVPPADVEGLMLSYDDERSSLFLKWNPVGLDAMGGAEYVSRYHVYRYDEGPPFPLLPAFLIGETVEPEIAVSGEALSGASLLVYRVVAEDEAGNVAGRRD